MSQDANHSIPIQASVEINPSELGEAAYNLPMLPRCCCSIVRSLLIILPVLTVYTAWAETSPPDPAKLDQATKDLASPDFERREAATRFLWQHADEASQQVDEARTSPDAEVRARANRIHEAHLLGILPDTPLDVARRIYEFHDGDVRQKRQILSQLIASDDLTTVQRLLRAVENDNLRAELAQGLASLFRVKLLDELIAEDWEKARGLLERAALTDVGMRDYATFAQLTETTDDALAKLPDTPHGRQVKLWLLRAAGRTEEAFAMVADNPEQTRTLKCADGDAVAFCEVALGNQDASPSLQARHRAFKARFSGDQAAYEAAIDDLTNIAKVTDDFHQREAINALFLNGVVDPVLPHLPRIPGKSAYDIQTYRGSYGAALKAIGIEADKPPFTKWMDERVARLRKDAQDPCFEEALELAANLLDMGAREEAERITQNLFEATEASDKRQKDLVRAELRLGMKARVEERLRKYAEKMTLDELRDTFMAPPTVIQQWFDYFVEAEDGKEAVPRIATLIRAWRLVDVGENDEPMPEKEIDSLLESAFEKAQAQPLRDRKNYLRGLWVTADAHGRRDLALQFMETLDELNPEGYWTGFLAEAQEERKQWLAAAKSYEALWQRSLNLVKTSLMQNNSQNGNVPNLQPEQLYRAGKAYENAGESAKGAEMIKQARLLCLGDLDTRLNLAQAMAALGDDAMAQEEWELIARLSQPDEAVSVQAFNILSIKLKKTDLKRAIRCLERSMVARHLIGNLRPEYIYTFDLSMQSRWCQWNALLQLEDDNADAALAAIKQYWELTPGNASIGEELLPKLETAGKAAEALDFYEKTRALSEEACILFPNSAMAHNNLAWLDARSRRKLDKALEHATIACELKPKTAAYIDTLAEVHFAMGDREKALELSAEAIKYLPDDEELKGQRKRFESAPLPEKR